jgi:hypothetical protein
MEADHLVRDAARTRGLPLARIHPGAVIGDSRTGETTQFFGFPPIVEAIWRGKLPMVPGGAGHWLPLVTVDFLAALIARVPATGSYTVLDDASPQLLELATGSRSASACARCIAGCPSALPEFLLRDGSRPATRDAERPGVPRRPRYDATSTRRLAAANNLRVGLSSAWRSTVVSTYRDRPASASNRPRQAARAHRRRAGASSSVIVQPPIPCCSTACRSMPDSWTPVASRIGGTQLRVDLPGLGRWPRSVRRRSSGCRRCSPTRGISALIGHLGTLRARARAR